MNDFWNDYCDSEAFILKNKKQIKFTKIYMENILIPYIKKLKREHPDVSIENFKEILKDDAFSIAKTAFESTYALDYYMIYIACKYLQKNQKKCKELYDSYDPNFDEKKFTLSPNHNLEDYLERFMYYAVPAYENKMKEILKLDPDLAYVLKKGKDSKEFDLYKKSLSSTLERDYKNTYIDYYFDGIVKFLPGYELCIESELKNTLSTSISEIAKQLQRLNLFERYKNTEIKNYEKLGLKDLAIAGSKYDLTNPELLKKSSIHDLMILNSFWINRYAKELDNYCKGIFAIYNLDLLQKILNDDYKLEDSDIDPEYISEILIKCNMLKYKNESYMNDMYLGYISGDYDTDMYTTFDDENFILYSFEPFGDLMRKRYGDEYDNFFNNLPGKTTIEDDCVLYGKLASPAVNIYSTKSEVLNGLIYNFSNMVKRKKDEDIVNAGIIPDEVSEDGAKISLNPNFICLGIDSKFTFPITEHIKLSVLKDFLSALQGNENLFVPLYEGHNDFTYEDGQLIKAQQIFPATKEFEKSVRELTRKSPSNLVNHLAWNFNSKSVPDIHKASFVNSKGKTKKRYIRRYINLADYNFDKSLSAQTQLPIYILEDEKYIPVEESGYTFSNIDSIIQENGDDPIEF